MIPRIDLMSSVDPNSLWRTYYDFAINTPTTAASGAKLNDPENFFKAVDRIGKEGVCNIVRPGLFDDERQFLITKINVVLNAQFRSIYDLILYKSYFSIYIDTAEVDSFFGFQAPAGGGLFAPGLAFDTLNNTPILGAMNNGIPDSSGAYYLPKPLLTTPQNSLGIKQRYISAAQTQLTSVNATLANENDVTFGVLVGGFLGRHLGE